MLGYRFTAGLLTILIASSVDAVEPNWRPSERTAVEHVEACRDELKQMNQALWKFAEVGLEEKQSSTLLIERLRKAGFEVKTGVSGMPTAFVASFGSGQPVIGMLAEYDALPGLSQKMSPQREAVVDDAPGHGCGHCGLGTAAVGAVIAAKEAMVKHGLKGTLRLYGTPAEETLIGKVYMTLDGVFDDLDVCLHWHPADRNEAWSGKTKAALSAKFTFHGVTAHASGSPESGRSALDAVELMNAGANFMREHIKEDARVHYVITDGGGAPNVVPAKATVWYYVRSDDHRDVEANFAWLKDIAQGAALMSRTKVTVQVDTDCHEVIVNDPLNTLLVDNLQRLGAPKFTTDEIEFARRLQAPLSAQFGTVFPKALDEEIHRVVRSHKPQGSTDVGDISWRVPTGGLKTACFAADSPGHSWQNVAAIGSSIGEKGVIYATQVLAVTMVDLLEEPAVLATAKADFDAKMKDRKYTTLIPKGQRPPAKIR